MAETDKKIDSQEEGNEKKRRTFLYYVLKTLKTIAWIASGIIAFVIVIVVAFSVLYQFHGFRTWFNGKAVGIVNSQLEGKIEIADLYIQPLKGEIVVDGLRVLAAGDTVAYIYKAHIFADFLATLHARTIVYNAYLESPRIKMIRNRLDSTWNIEHISKPSYDTTAKKLNWTFDVRKFTINNGFVLFVDSTKVFPKTDMVDFNNLFLKNLNLDLTALAEVGTGKFSANIRQYSVYEQNSRTQINNMQLQADLDSTQAYIKNLAILTPNSNIHIKASVKNLNLLGKLSKDKLNNANMAVNVNAGPISTADLKKFLLLNMNLPDTASINISASGTFREAFLGEFKLNTGKSFIDIQGTARGLLESSELSYSAYIQGTKIDYNELVSIFPEGSRASFPKFVQLDLNKVYAEGNTKMIRVNLDARSSVGSVSGWTKTDWSGPLAYEGKLALKDVHLEKITNNPALSSSINGNIEYNARGTDPQAINASVKLHSTNSRYTNYNFREVALNANMNKGLLTLDTLFVVLNNPVRDDTLNQNLPAESSLSMHGRLDITNMKMPRYELNTYLTNINVAQLAQSTSAPEIVSGNIILLGEGFDPDSISTTIDAKLSDVLFKSVSLLPFDMKLVLERQDKNTRRLSLTSKFMDATLAGTYNFSNLAGLVKTQASYLTNFISDRINSVIPTTYASATAPAVADIEKFSPLDLHLIANVNDVSAFAPLINASVLTAKANLDLNLKVTEDLSTFKTDTFRITNFRMEIPQDSLRVNVTPLNLNANLQMGIRDYHPYLNSLRLRVRGDSDITLNSLVIGKPFAALVQRNDSTKIFASTTINNMANIATRGTLQFNPGSLDVILDTLSLTYNKTMRWTNTQPIDVALNQDIIDIKSFNMKRANAESISITGQFDKQNINNANIVISDMPLASILPLLPPEKQDYLESISGQLDTLRITARGSTASPLIDITLRTSPIFINDMPGGVIAADLHHANAVVTGNAGILSIDTLNPRKLVDIDVKAFPINLGVNGVKERLPKNPAIDINVKGDSLPLVLANPFSVGVQDLSGYLNADFHAGGNFPDAFVYDGKVTLLNARYLLQANNLYYTANGEVSLNNDHVSINNLVLQNAAEDLPGGKATINGEVKMQNLSPKNMNIQLKADQFKLLGKESEKSMPTLYGDLVIGSPNGLVFSGTLQQPQLSGKIIIRKADLTLAQAPGSQDVKSNVIYQRGNKITEFSVDTSSVERDSSGAIVFKTSAPTTDSTAKAEVASQPFIYDLYVQIPDQVNISMDIGPVGNLSAIIGTTDPNTPVRLTPDRYGSSPILNGGIVVMEGSELDFIFNKKFKTHGTITFPTGRIDNPALDLTAEYTGSTSESQPFTVYLYITGTKEQPEIKIDYTINDVKAVGDPSEIQGDAISLMLFGTTQKDILAQGGGSQTPNASAYGTSALNSQFASGASQLLTTALGQSGFIKAVNIDMGNSTGGWEDSRISFSTGELFKGMRLKFGGSIADLYGNNQVTFEYRIPIQNPSQFFNNILFQLSKSSSQNINIISRNQKEWEFKFKLGGSW